MTEETLTKDVMLGDDELILPVPSSVVKQIKDLLVQSKLPRSARWLRNRLNGAAAMRVNSALHRLEEAQEIEYGRNGMWRVVGLEGKHNVENKGSHFDPRTLIGPVWEPRVAQSLVRAGLPVIQQKHELSYFLDIAVMCANGAKLNVEVDGRTHRRYDGRRRTGDIIRDAQLRSRGWTVYRVWVKDLMLDFDARIEEIVGLWKTLKGGV